MGRSKVTLTIFVGCPCLVSTRQVFLTGIPVIIISIFVSPAKQKRDICLACKAEARYMYCFSGVIVVVVVGGVNFFVFRSFSRKVQGLEPRNLGHACILKS